MSSLRVLLVGCGRIGAHTAPRLREALPSVWFPYSHLDAALEVGDVDVVGVCDHDAEIARSTAAAHGIEGHFSDPETAIAACSPDIVLVATRMAGRADILRAAIRGGARGLHFEKPLAGSITECREVMDLAAAERVAVTYGAVRRYMDVPRAARDLVASGDVGELRHISVESGVGELFWAHPHNFDLITFFAGMAPVLSVQATLDLADGVASTAVVDADPFVRSCWIAYEGGVGASISVTGTSLLRIHCERAELVIGGNASWLQVTPRVPGDMSPPATERRAVEHTMSGRRRAIEELVHSIRGESCECHSPGEIVRINELGLASAWSAVHGGRTVDLADVPLDFTVTGRKGDLYA